MLMYRGILDLIAVRDRKVHAGLHFSVNVVVRLSRSSRKVIPLLTNHENYIEDITSHNS